MKNASRLLAMLLAVAMFAAVAFTVSAFEDVNVEDDCYTAVNTLVSLNVIKGKTETEFAPDDAVTREQMAALMSRLYTTVAIEGGGNYTPFTDLDDPYYNNVISWCYDAGVINGTTPSTFEPKANIMLQDAVTMACRLIGYNDLTYPLGYLTKGRLIGLLDGLEEVAYDKELTRGETAILLYNTLDADGAEIISGSTVEWFDKVDGNGVVTDSYPLVVAYERNFTIAYDVYNFKTTTFQVVGTENFNLAGYANGDEDVLTIVEVNDKKQYVGAAMSKDYEDLMIAEDTNSDDFILTYIDVLYKGDDINDEDTVVLSTTVVTNTDAKDEIGVYYKKNSTTGKLVAQDNKILVNDKPYEAQNLVYTINANGTITKFAPVADDTTTTNVDETYNLSDAAPIFFQADPKDEAAYAQLVYDLDNDGKVDVVMFIPAELHKITKITNKGEYTLKNVNDTNAANIVIKTEDENETKTLVILADEVAKDDYVLTYTFGSYTYISEVLEPVITTVTKKSNKNYTLATGDVVSFAKNNLPVVAGPANTNLALDGEEVALYIVNGKIVYSDNATNLGYNPYTYAFVVNKADDETYVDVEDGTVEKVYNLIAFINGKAVTIPTYVDYSADPNWASYLNEVVTVDDIKDGKYILKTGIQVKDSYYETLETNKTITYNTVSKLYKIDGKIITLDENSELYVRNNKNIDTDHDGIADTQVYDTVKRYTMNNTPTTAFQNGQKIDSALLRKNYDDDGKVKSYTLVVGYVNVTAGDVFGGGTDYTDYRILLATGLALDTKKNASYATYDVLNPVTGDVETVVDTTTEVNAASTLAAGTVVKFRSNNKIDVVSNANAIFNGTGLHGITEMIQVNRVINDNIVTFFKGNDATVELTKDSNGAELMLNGAKVVVLTLNDEGEYEVELTDDYSELEGKVVRLYTQDSLSYKAYYVVVVPYQWLEGALEDNKADDLFTNLDAYTDYLA